MRDSPPWDSPAPNKTHSPMLPLWSLCPIRGGQWAGASWGPSAPAQVLAGGHASPGPPGTARIPSSPSVSDHCLHGEAMRGRGMAWVRAPTLRSCVPGRCWGQCGPGSPEAPSHGSARDLCPWGSGECAPSSLQVPGFAQGVTRGTSGTSLSVWPCKWTHVAPDRLWEGTRGCGTVWRLCYGEGVGGKTNGG